MGSVELPYQSLLDEAGRHGRVLHRENIYGSGPPVDAVSEEILAFVAAHVGRRVLDVGCGLGPYIVRLTEMGRECVGAEVNPQVVESARAMGRDVRLVSAYDLGFADKSFDSVVLVETLEHLEDYRQALTEAARVARETIVVTVPDISCLPVMSKRLLVPWHLLEATHLNFFTPEILRKALLEHTRQCEVTRLGHFFDVDGEAIYMHAAAVARV